MKKGRRPKQQPTRPPEHRGEPSPSTTAADTRIPAGFLAVVTGIGLIAGLYAFTLVLARDLGLGYDDAIYLQIADKISGSGCPILTYGHGTLFVDNPPFVMYVAAFARLLFGDGLFWQRAAHATLWALTTYVATFLLATRMFGVVAGLVAVAGFYTESRFMIEAAMVKLDVPLATLSVLFLVSLYALCDPQRAAARRRNGIVCAVLVALACLTKYQGVLLAGTGVLYLLLSRWLRWTAATPPRRSFAEGWMVGGVLVGALIWYVLATRCGGDPVGAVRWGLNRVTFKTAEPWFHRPLLVLWSDLAILVGPLFVGGLVASVLTWRSKLFTDRRLVLLWLWIVVTFVFCSAIGLRNERYFLLAVPAFAVLLGSLVSPDAYNQWPFRRYPRLAQPMRLGVAAVVILMALFALYQSVAGLAEMERIGVRSNRHYMALGEAVKNRIPQGESVVISRAQTAYFAERNYFWSEYEVDGMGLIRLISDPKNRITAIAEDSPQLFHQDMPQTDRQKVWAYIQTHFTRVPISGIRGAVYYRTAW